MAISRIPKKETPYLFDTLIEQIQDHIGNEIPWLDHIFGKAERLVKEINGRAYRLPYVHVGNGEYIGVAPDSHLGNFVFFEIDDPQEVEYNVKYINTVKADVSLILWCDLRTITITKDRNTEGVKNDILTVANGGFYNAYGRVQFTSIYEEKDNVFRRYDLDELDNQFMMYPYYALRLKGRMFVNQDCVVS